uniref:EGF-like domain-containing protein n=1 Tax=Amphilophus citrinellus TaxID=61819 RepID=A0A3Q0RV40_AMPCI
FLWKQSGSLAPTHPSLRSEVFKPCVEDKDLAFCLNEGECSIIETVAGVHRHCRCKEGYHGLRCDQFVPKTDAILSDPSTLFVLLFILQSCQCHNACFMLSHGTQFSQWDLFYVL